MKAKRTKTEEALRAEREKERERRPLRLYGITIAERDAMIESQENRCPICDSEFSVTGRRRPVIDHCHERGRVRGILCHSCNRGLGVFDDDMTALRRAADYLEGS